VQSEVAQLHFDDAFHRVVGFLINLHRWDILQTLAVLEHTTRNCFTLLQDRDCYGEFGL